MDQGKNIVETMLYVVKFRPFTHRLFFTEDSFRTELTVPPKNRSFSTKPFEQNGHMCVENAKKETKQEPIL